LKWLATLTTGLATAYRAACDFVLRVGVFLCINVNYCTFGLFAKASHAALTGSVGLDWSSGLPMLSFILFHLFNQQKGHKATYITAYLLMCKIW